MVNPALSVIRVRTYEFGRRAGEMLLARLAGGPPPPTVDIGFEVLVRHDLKEPDLTES